MLDKLDKVDELLRSKHLPLRHDQQRHAGSRGAASAELIERLDDLCRSLSSEHRRVVEDAITEYNIPLSDLEGLSGITTDVPPGYTYEGGLLQSDNPFHVSRDYSGAYIQALGVVNLNPYKMSDERMKKTVLHEVGHHATLTGRSDLVSNKNIGRIYDELRVGFPQVRDKLQAIGLREYSVKTDREFLADCYTARLAGDTEQRANLERLLQADADELYEIMDEVLKEYAAFLPVLEIKAYQKGDIVEFKWESSIVGVSALSEIPWYYVKEY